MTSKEIREKYIKFFTERGHKEIPAAPLVLENDQTTLFTSAGMQPLAPYLKGQPHLLGKRLVNSQPSFRSQDIMEVGDNRHTTFFEMLGNWSLDDYFKKEQIPWCYEFLTKELELPAERLCVTVFEGTKDVPRDEESAQIWKKLGIPDERIFYYGADKNWWSMSGAPDSMKPGDIGGPDSEVFYDFGEHLHDKDEPCHPNCECGRFLEIGNSVFIQYFKDTTGGLKELPQKNVDFGGGLERIAAVVNNNPDIFKTDLFLSVIDNLELFSGYKYGKNIEVDQAFRVIADHIKAATFLIKNGILPSNKLQGYVLRRLIRRAAVKSKKYFKYDLNLLANLSSKIVAFYHDTADYFEHGDLVKIHDVIFQEVKKFEESLNAGLREIDKRLNKYDTQFGWLDSPENAAEFAFDLYQTYGLPMDAYFDDLLKKFGIAYAWGQRGELYKEFEKLREGHSNLSKTSSAGIFKGGLVEDTPQTRKLHTATHLLHAALREVLGEHVKQMGSNITPERLRFDFSHPKPLTEEEIKLISELVNQKIQEILPVSWKETTLNEALKEGALAFFGEKYGGEVKVYMIGPSTLVRQTHHRSGSPFSREVCGGPHVENTGEIGRVTITKEEGVGTGVRRIYAELR